jgi:co-chaperonin GroES (HSP10)|tara:strand:- start:3009 stop:3263 length:255 start_codon:yes stop_codon:yes gene_type:complete
MKAIGNYIVVKEQTKNVSKTLGGLELIEKDREGNRYKKGVVVSSGPDILKEDKTIIYDRVGSHSIEFEEELYQVISLRDVVAVL